MKKITLLLLIICMSLLSFSQNDPWHAKRITANQNQNESNSWYNFRKDVEIESVPDKALARVACDSKYWLWINGELAVFEGQLKRGPTPEDTYYDAVDIAPYLNKGQNTIAILVWYFGKDGFSHNSSGQAGLVFQCDAIDLVSDGSWRVRLDKAFICTGPPNPNYRLPESDIKFDARNGDFDWTKPDEETADFGSAKVVGEAESAPWNDLVKRPIPHWKDYGVREYENHASLPDEGKGEWIKCELPYNCHITPILDVEAPAGLIIKMQTDNFDYMGLNVASVRAEYVTKEGKQRYESLGWMNGHVVEYFIPEGVEINSLKYRETGYGSEFSGFFNCSDPFYDKLWQKAVRTLYVTMRDTYMDCPDRERAQWWGDVVNESGEAFYALSPASADLTKKGILELINWQRKDSTIYSPVPEGNWDKELPGQMLASVGFYGFWNYYLNTGDRQTIASVYDGVKRYLDVWELKSNGTLVERQGEWYWGDWGRQVDKQLLYNAWYYLALKGYRNMAELVDNKEEAQRIRKEMDAFKSAFNSVFWDGKGYRTAEYEGEYDDRAQALAVVSGLADESKYDELLNIFKNSYLASPYMEKYVLEALFVMGEPEFGLKRMKDRYYGMIELSPYTTLYENFGPRNLADTSEFVGHGTNNHAWSGGGLTILSQYVCGLEPIEPAWKTFKVKPQLGSLEFAETGNETVAGKVSVKIERGESGMKMELTVPEKSEAVVHIPGQYRKVAINNTTVWDKGYVDNEMASSEGEEEGYNCFRLYGGTYQITSE
jgi:hypothetical protein